MLIQADARSLPLDDQSVQCCVTSPPYWGLRDYGIDGQLGLEPTPEEYVANMVAVFREVRRVLKDDGTLWLNLGDSYAATGKSGGGDQGRRWEDHGADTEGPRGGKWSPAPPGLKPKDLVGIPWRVAFALQADGWWLRSDIIWAKPNPMPESITDRPTKAHEYIFLLSKSARYYYDADALRSPYKPETFDRYSYPMQNTAPQARQPDGNMSQRGKNRTKGPNELGCNIRTVWTIATQPYPDAHFATFPEEIPRRCIKAGSKPGDTVLDPFAGSGTVVAMAIDLGREGIGIELNPEYIELAERRLRSKQRPLIPEAR